MKYKLILKEHSKRRKGKKNDTASFLTPNNSALALVNLSKYKANTFYTKSDLSGKTGFARHPLYADADSFKKKVTDNLKIAGAYNPEISKNIDQVLSGLEDMRLYDFNKGRKTTVEALKNLMKNTKDVVDWDKYCKDIAKGKLPLKFRGIVKMFSNAIPTRGDKISKNSGYRFVTKFLPKLFQIAQNELKSEQDLGSNKINSQIDNVGYSESANYLEALDVAALRAAQKKAGGSKKLARKLRDEKHERNQVYLDYVNDLKRMKKNGVSIPKQDVDDIMAYTYSTQGDNNISSLKKLFDTKSKEKNIKSQERRRRRMKRDADSIRLSPEFGLFNSADEFDKKEKLRKDPEVLEGFVVSESYGKYGDVKSIRPKKKPKKRKINSDRFDYKIPKSTPASIKDQNPTSVDIVSTNTTDNALSKLINKSIVTGITGDPIQLKKSISFFNSLKNEIAKVVSTNKNSRKYPMLKSMISSSDNKDPEFIFKSLVQKPIEYISDVLSVMPGSVAKGKAGKDIRRMVKIGDQLEQSSGQSKSTLLANLNKILQSL